MRRESDSDIIHTSPAKDTFVYFEDDYGSTSRATVIMWGTTRGGKVVPLILHLNELVNAASFGEFSHIDFEGE